MFPGSKLFYWSTLYPSQDISTKWITKKQKKRWGFLQSTSEDIHNISPSRLLSFEQRNAVVPGQNDTDNIDCFLTESHQSLCVLPCFVMPLVTCLSQLCNPFQASLKNISENGTKSPVDTCMFCILQKKMFLSCCVCSSNKCTAGSVV